MKKAVNTPLFNVSVFAMFWALQLFVSKLSFLAGANPITFTIQEYLVSFMFIALLVFYQGGIVFKGITPKIFHWLAVALIIHFAAGSVLSNFGISLTPAINAAFLVRFSLVTTTLLAWIILREKLTKSKILAVVVMLAGVYLVSTQGRLITPHIGDFLILGACFSWSLGNVLIKRFINSDRLDPLVVTFLRPVLGLPPLLLIIFVSSIVTGPWQKVFVVNLLDFGFVPYVLVAGFCDFVNTIFLYRTLRVASASYMTLMSNTTPVLVTIMAIVFLRESLAGAQLLGAGLIIVASVVTHYLKIDKQ